jgi:hypothetical protein
VKKVDNKYVLKIEDIKILEDFVRLGQSCGDFIEQSNKSHYQPMMFATATKLKEFIPSIEYITKGE